MEQKDLIKGEIYKGGFNYDKSEYWIFKYKKEELHYSGQLNKGEHSHNLDWYEEATPEEKHWLECCIKADKFIPKEEAMKSFNQVKVFGKFDIGQIVVSLAAKSNGREVGNIYKILEDSYKTKLKYLNSTIVNSSFEKEEWRAATQEEIEAYNNGIRNIKDIKKELKKDNYIIVLSDDRYSWGRSSGNEKLIINEIYKVKYVNSIEISLYTKNDSNWEGINILNPIENEDYRLATKKEIDYFLEHGTLTTFKEETMETNVWYKSKSGSIVYRTKDVGNYGLLLGKWSACIVCSDSPSWTKISDEEAMERLLEYAKKKYPVGTEFKSAYLPTLPLKKIKENNIFEIRNGKDISTQNGNYVYYQGKWAEIVSLPEDKPKENKPEFKVGKWYKWYQENHNTYHYGKFDNINDAHFVMKPWIIHCKSYDLSGTFEIKHAKEIKEISSEEIQKYLPDDHCDKVKEKFKVGDWLIDSVNEIFQYTDSSGYSYRGKRIDGSIWSKVKKACRLATPEEIARVAKKEEVEKWNAGSWVVWKEFRDGMQYYSFKPESKVPYQIEELIHTETIRIKGTLINVTYPYNSDNLEWFTTYEEAKEFSDKLLGKNIPGIKGESFNIQLKDKWITYPFIYQELCISKSQEFKTKEKVSVSLLIKKKHKVKKVKFSPAKEEKSVQLIN